MRVTLALTLAVLLHSEVAIGLDPTYEELKSQLPNLHPNGDDQFFFFIVPVQKNDEPNVILQLAQAQDASKYNNGSISSTKVNTADNSVNVSAMGDNLNLDEVFSTPEDDDPSDFNFQVPVIVPLDFHFRYDELTASTPLPQCTVDSRTWKEKVITKIAEKLELEGEQTWDHSDMTIRIRLRKDALSSITLDHITTTVELSRYVNTIVQTKYLSDIRYTNILNETVTLTAEHLAIIAEGVDTYNMIMNTIALAEAAADKLDADISKIQIDAIKPGAKESLKKFKEALVIVRELKQKAEEYDDEEEEDEEDEE